MRRSAPLPARARLHCALRRSLALFATLLAASACDNSSEPNLVPAPEFASCIDYGEHLRINSSVPLADAPYDMLIDNGFLYAALFNKIQTFDLSDADYPTSVSVIEVAADHIAKADKGLCAVGFRRLTIVDVTPPSAPKLVSELTFPFQVYGIAARGDCVYLAAGDYGLWVVNLTNPSQPRIMGSVDTPSRATTVGLSGNLALVVCGNDPETSALQVIDVSDPSSPRRLGYATGVIGSNIELEGSLAIVCGMSSHTYVVDISDPASPLLLAAHQGAQDIVVEGSRAYTCGPSFQAHNIVNPSSPVVLGTIRTRASTIALDGERVYLGQPDGQYSQLNIVHVTNPTSPQPLAKLNLQTFPWRMAVREDVLLLCAGDLIAFDIRGQMPVIRSRLPIQAFDVALDDSFAYVTSLEDGLTIIELGTDSGNRIRGSINLPGFALGVAVADSLVYLTLDDYGLWIIDVSDPSQCRVLGSADTPGDATDVTVRGRFAYVTDTVAGLVVVDVGTPSSPSIVNTAGSGFGTANAIALSAEFAYVAAGSAGLAIFDISQPAKPDFISSFPSVASWRDITLDGSFAYMVGEDVLVIDVADPYSPALVGSAQTGFTTGVALDPTRVFVSCAQDGSLMVLPKHCDRVAGRS